MQQEVSELALKGSGGEVPSFEVKAGRPVLIRSHEEKRRVCLLEQVSEVT